MNYKNIEALFRAFCDENRLKILELLREGERCGSSILKELNITQPTLSHHMKILCDSGIVGVNRVGKRVHYSISDKGIMSMKDSLDHFLNHSHERVDVPECRDLDD